MPSNEAVVATTSIVSTQLQAPTHSPPPLPPRGSAGGARGEGTGGRQGGAQGAPRGGANASGPANDGYRAPVGRFCNLLSEEQEQRWLRIVGAAIIAASTNTLYLEGRITKFNVLRFILCILLAIGMAVEADLDPVADAQLRLYLGMLNAAGWSLSVGLASLGPVVDSFQIVALVIGAIAFAFVRNHNDGKRRSPHPQQRPVDAGADAPPPAAGGATGAGVAPRACAAALVDVEKGLDPAA